MAKTQFHLPVTSPTLSHPSQFMRSARYFATVGSSLDSPGKPLKVRAEAPQEHSAAGHPPWGHLSWGHPPWGHPTPTGGTRSTFISRAAHSTQPNREFLFSSYVSGMSFLTVTHFSLREQTRPQREVTLLYTRCPRMTERRCTCTVCHARLGESHA